MRPTRTAGLTAIAIAVSAAWAVLGIPLAASAEPVPESCPHLTIDRGEFDFVELPSDAPDALRSIAWDCGFTVPDGESRWQFDLSGGSYEQFLALVDALFADEAWTFTSGTIGSLTDLGAELGPETEEWPQSLSEGMESARASFSSSGAGPIFFVTLDWQESTADGATLNSASWGWGGDEPGEELPFNVTRDPGVASYLILELSKFGVEFVPAAPDRAGIATPSSISRLNTIATAIPSPVETAVMLASGVLLTLLIGYPGYLLTGVLAARWDRWFGWARRPTERIRRFAALPQRAWVFWVGVAVASFIAAFIDPKFGLNWLSVRLYLTLFAAFALFNIGAWLVIRRVLRRIDPEAKPAMRFRMGSILAVLIAVLISRLLSLDPGIVFGLVAGLVFATTLLAARRAQIVLIGTGFAAAAGIAAWVVYSILSATIGGVDSGVSVFFIEFFGGLTIQGVATLPLALLPLALLDGAELFGWNRVYWAISYFLASVLFLLVMLTVPGGLTTIPGDYLRWLGLYLAFAIVATAVWGVDRLVERRRATAGLAESEASR